MVKMSESGTCCASGMVAAQNIAIIAAGLARKVTREYIWGDFLRYDGIGAFSGQRHAGGLAEPKLGTYETRASY